MAFVLLLFSSSALLFAVAAFAASAIGILDLYCMIIRINRIRFSSLLAVSILLGYGLGSAIYLVANQTLHATEYQYWAVNGLFFSQRGLSVALAASLLACAVLYMRSWFERGSYPILSLASLACVKSERLVWLGVVLAAVALYIGDIGYMGATVSATGNVSPLGAIVNLMIPALVPYTLLLITINRSTKRAALIIAQLFFIGVLFLLGRRYLLYAVVLSAIALRMRGYRFTKRGVAATVVLSILAIAVLYWGFNFFMALRLAINEHGWDASLLENVRSAMSQLGGAQAKVVQAILAKNVGSRPFILSYLAGLMGINSSQMPAWGAELFYSIQSAIPSILMPGKTGALPPSPEALIHPLYGIPVFDGPNSILVAGFDDFGLVGAVIYPLGVVVLYRWFYRGLRIVVQDPSVRLFVFFSLIFELLYVEQGLSSAFVTVRNLVIIIAIAWGLARLPTVRLRSRLKIATSIKSAF